MKKSIQYICRCVLQSTCISSPNKKEVECLGFSFESCSALILLLWGGFIVLWCDTHQIELIQMSLLCPCDESVRDVHCPATLQLLTGDLVGDDQLIKTHWCWEISEKCLNNVSEIQLNELLFQVQSSFNAAIKSWKQHGYHLSLIKQQRHINTTQ